MNAAGLALSAANPGLLALALTDYDGFGGLSYGRRPVRYETDDETLQRVERALAERERKAEAQRIRDAWFAVPGNKAIYERQEEIGMRLYAINREEERIKEKRAEAARKERYAAEEKRVEGKRTALMLSLMVAALVFAGVTRFSVGWLIVDAIAAVVIGCIIMRTVSMGNYYDPDDSDRGYGGYWLMDQFWFSPFGESGPDFRASIEDAEAFVASALATHLEKYPQSKLKDA